MSSSSESLAAPGSSAEAASKDGELEGAVKRFQELRAKEQQLLTKISEMAGQEQEFRIVCDRLRPLDAGRRAYHLIGGVLCERTVGDVVPVLESNREAIKQVIGSLNEQLKAANAERMVLQKKHGIRVVSREQAERIAAEQAARDGPPAPPAPPAQAQLQA